MPRPFTVGTKCKTKSKPFWFCEIVGVNKNATRKHIWTVKFPDDGSTLDGVKSQQLLRLGDEDIFPTPSISSAGTDPTEDSEQDKDSTSDEMEPLEEWGDEDEDREEEDPDDVEAEDIAVVVGDEGDPEYFFNNQDLEDEEKHARNTKKYEKAKKKTLAELWTVEVEAGEAKFEAGATVTLKKDPTIEGVIVQRADDGVKWIVDFGGNGEPKCLPYQAMKLVESPNEVPFVWKLIENSQPENPIVEYAQCGLIGFDFLKVSESAVKITNEQEYSYPYFDLFLKLWPGDWKKQLWKMNSFIVRENETNKRHKNRRMVQEVTPSEWWVFHGVLLAASAEGVGGRNMFSSS